MTTTQVLSPKLATVLGFIAEIVLRDLGVRVEKRTLTMHLGAARLSVQNSRTGEGPAVPTSGMRYQCGPGRPLDQET